MKVSLYYGGQKLSDESLSQPKSAAAADSSQGTVIWDEWYQMLIILLLPNKIFTHIT